jgi:excisionase family DNA binding protein
MNKQEAAEYLGVSPRQIERYTKENRIGVRFEKGRTKPTPVYDEGELQRFKESLEKPIYQPAVQRMESGSEALATQSDSAMSALSQLSQFEAFGRMMEAMKPQLTAPSITEEASLKILLKLDECSALTGLSRAVLREAIDAGQLKAQQIGRAWRIKRTDLDSYIAEL